MSSRHDDTYLGYSLMDNTQVNQARRLIQQGWMSMKQWALSESERLGISHGAVYMRLHRGYYPELVIARFNPRVILVKPLPQQQNANQTIHQ